MEIPIQNSQILDKNINVLIIEIETKSHKKEILQQLVLEQWE